MKHIKICIICFCLSFSHFSNAQQFETGNGLISACKKAEAYMDGENVQDYISAAWCVGIVQGTKNVLAAVSQSIPERQYAVCLPDRVTKAQAVRVVNDYLERNSDILHLPPSILITYALREAYPCD